MSFSFRVIISIFISAFIISYNANADNFSSGPLCYMPSKPLLFSPKYLQQRYEKDMLEYHSCVESYILDQKRAIQLHTDSITQAKELLKD